MFSISTASKESIISGIKALIYGEAGSGKTVSLATSPSPILISVEAGTLSLQSKNLIRLYGKDNSKVTYDMPIIVARSIKELIDIYNWCKASKEASKYQTIALDSLSEIAELILHEAKGDYKDQRQAYIELINKTEPLMRNFRDLKYNIIFVCKQEHMRDEFTGVTRYGPSMPGAKLSNKLPYFFDEVFQLGLRSDAEGKKYRSILTQQDLRFIAKDRSGVLDPHEKPFLSHIFDKILGATK